MESTDERAMRFIEEAIELVQAAGLPPENIHRMVDIKYAEPVGETEQEIGGAMITLLALSEHFHINAGVQLCIEYDRIHTPEVIAKCQAKVRKKMDQGIFGQGLNLETDNG